MITTSFMIGMLGALMGRIGATKMLKWPVLSSTIILIVEPLLILPEILIGGFSVSFFDYYRRVALEITLLNQ